MYCFHFIVLFFFPVKRWMVGSLTCSKPWKNDHINYWALRYARYVFVCNNWIRLRYLYFLLITISSNFVLQPTGSVQWTANNRGKLKLISFLSHYFSSCFLTSCFHTHTHTHQVFLMNPGSQGLISWSIISLFCEICFFLCCIRSLQGPQRREKIQPLCMKRLAAIHIHQSWSKCCNLCKWKCLLANHSFLSVEWILMTAGDMVEQCRSGADQAD